MIIHTEIIRAGLGTCQIISIRIQPQPGMYPRNDVSQFRSVIARSFRGFLPKLCGNLIVQYN